MCVAHSCLQSGFTFHWEVQISIRSYKKLNLIGCFLDLDVRYVAWSVSPIFQCRERLYRVGTDQSTFVKSLVVEFWIDNEQKTCAFSISVPTFVIGISVFSNLLIIVGTYSPVHFALHHWTSNYRSSVWLFFKFSSVQLFSNSVYYCSSSDVFESCAPRIITYYFTCVLFFFSREYIRFQIFKMEFRNGFRLNFLSFVLITLLSGKFYFVCYQNYQIYLHTYLLNNLILFYLQILNLRKLGCRALMVRDGRDSRTKNVFLRKDAWMLNKK